MASKALSELKQLAADAGFTLCPEKGTKHQKLFLECRTGPDEPPIRTMVGIMPIKPSDSGRGHLNVRAQVLRAIRDMKPFKQ